MTRVCVAAPEPTAPAWRLPAGACDTHVHAIGPFARYPLAAVRPYTPPEAPLSALIAMLDTMGLTRAVIAHVSAHGMDLSVTLDAVAALGERARGVALLSADVTDAQLDALHAAGMRGVRLSHAYGLDTAINEAALRSWADRVGPRGWHIAMWPQEIEEFELLRDLADRLPIPLVIDHLANRAWLPSLGTAQPGFRLIEALLASGNAWIKLSAPNRASDAGSPWPDLVPFAAALIEADPTRLLWASDWPHVGVWSDAAMPRSGDLLDWLRVIGCDDALLRTILVANPEALYGFAPSTATAR